LPVTFYLATLLQERFRRRALAELPAE
jgi:hypothetical protein